VDVAGAGKDTFYPHALKLGGFRRWRMTLHFEVWLVATGKGSWEEVFYTKPPRVRKILQAEITALRQTFDVNIWLDPMTTWLHTQHEIVGIDCPGTAVTAPCFLIEMRGIRAMAGKILHLEAADQQANVAPELRGHRSEVELDSPEVLELRDAYLYDTKKSLGQLVEDGEDALYRWGWL
jgi:hypothetical protein